MPVISNQDDVSAEVFSGGVRRQRLIDSNRVENSVCLFDRLTVEPGGGLAFCVPRSGVAWGQILQGKVTFGKKGQDDHSLSASSAAFFPPGFEGSLHSSSGAVLIVLSIPDAARLDPLISQGMCDVCCIDLNAEPVLESEHDDRTRIYVATRKLFGTTALSGELVAFPPGVTSSNHHHRGAEHFQYILQGKGIVYLDEQPTRIRAGDLIYKYDLERHYCENDGDEEMAFVEFFVPGEFETVWVNPEQRCAWSPTGRNARGEAPTRNIATHTSDGTVYDDV